MKNFITSSLILLFLFCSFLCVIEKSSPVLNDYSTSSSQSWYNDDDEVLSAAICTEKPSSVRLFAKTISGLSWLSILLQFIHILLFACISYCVWQVQNITMSQRFIIRYIHDKDGHKALFSI